MLEGDPDVVGLSALYLPQLTFALALARWLDAEQPPRAARRPLVLPGSAATSHVEVPELIAAGLVAAFSLRLLRRNRLQGWSRIACLGLVLAATGVVLVAADFGGRMVYGPDYLSW